MMPDPGVRQDAHQVPEAFGEVVLRVDERVRARTVREDVRDAELIEAIVEGDVHLLDARLE